MKAIIISYAPFTVEYSDGNNKKVQSYATHLLPQEIAREAEFIVFDKPVEITIGLAHVANYINGHITGLLEATESQSVKADKQYVIFEEWIGRKGDKGALCLSGSDIMDSYHKFGTGILPVWIARTPDPLDLAKRIFVYLTKI